LIGHIFTQKVEKLILLPSGRIFSNLSINHASLLASHWSINEDGWQYLTRTDFQAIKQ
jgi:hypothetical protein